MNIKVNIMNNDLPLLSINIPTYNRPAQIQEQVRRILPQLNKEVVLNVFDNRSDISVESLFSNEEREQFNIIRNKTNIGADANIARCFESCETKWLWTLSDDDYILPNAINTILKYIKNNINCVFINVWSNLPGITTTYNEFAQKLSDQSMFSAAFAMSTCLYNWEKLHDDMHIYYKYLSSKVGTLIMVAHNIRRTNGSCFFINNSVVDLGADVGWSYKEYIFFSTLITDAFMNDRVSEKILLGYHKTNYKLIEINRKSSNLGYFERYSLFIKTTRLQGFLKAITLCPGYWFKSLISVVLGSRLAQFIFRNSSIFVRRLWHAKINLSLLLNRVRWMLFGRRLKNQYDIPIVINNFNRLEMLCRLVNSLETRGYNNIYILDNMSSYPPLLSYYKTCPHKVIMLNKNLGYLALWKSELYKEIRSGYYIYTDSDMEIDNDCPNNFVEHFLCLMKKYPMAQKVGFGIRIDDLPDYYNNKQSVIEWEKQFWKKQFENGVYQAPIDTTFALYRPYCSGPASDLKLNIRTGFPYLIRHLPWYVDSSNLTEEEEYYIGNSCQSTHWSKNN